MLLKQSPFKLVIEWLFVDVDGYKIFNVYKPPPKRLQTFDLPRLLQPCLHTGHFNCLHADWGYGFNGAGSKCLAGRQVLTTLLSFVTQRILPAFTLTAEKVAIILIVRLLVLIRTAVYLKDVF